jgi:hypothetical protein
LWSSFKKCLLLDAISRFCVTFSCSCLTISLNCHGFLFSTIIKWGKWYRKWSKNSRLKFLTKF